MATFQTEAKKIGLNDIKTSIQSTNSDVDRITKFNQSATFDLYADDGSIFDKLKAMQEYAGDTTGINASKVDDMKKAISAYVTKLRTHLDEVQSSASSAKAYAGEYATSTEKYVKSLCDSCSNIISHLLMFSDKLDEIKAAYESRANTMATDIQSQSADLDKSFQEYTNRS